MAAMTPETELETGSKAHPTKNGILLVWAILRSGQLTDLLVAANQRGRSDQDSQTRQQLWRSRCSRVTTDFPKSQPKTMDFLRSAGPNPRVAGKAPDHKLTTTGLCGQKIDFLDNRVARVVKRLFLLVIRWTLSKD